MPRPQRTPEEIEEMRQRILEKAHELIHEGGPANLTVRRIAERLGVSHMTLYGYFSSRQELLNALHEQNFARVRARHEDLMARAESGDILGAIEEELSIYRRMAKRRPEMLQLLLASKLPHDEMHCKRVKRFDFQIEFLTRLINVGIEQGRLAERDARRAAMVVLGMVIGPLTLQVLDYLPDEPFVDDVCDDVIAQALRYLQA